MKKKRRVKNHPNSVTGIQIWWGEKEVFDKVHPVFFF